MRTKQTQAKSTSNIGQVENAEVQKRMYENWSMQVRRIAAYWFLVPYWLANVYVEAWTS